MNVLYNDSNFPSCCKFVSDDFIYIKDLEPCEVVSSSDFHFYCINPKNEQILFVQIDGCVYNSQDGKKCDCLLSNDQKTYLVEIKELLITKSGKKIRSKRTQAKRQIAETINKLKNRFGNNIDLSQIYGVICIIPTMDNNFTMPINSLDQVAIAKFLNECGCPNLYEGHI